MTWIYCLTLCNTGDSCTSLSHRSAGCKCLSIMAPTYGYYDSIDICQDLWKFAQKSHNLLRKASPLWNNWYAPVTRERMIILTLLVGSRTVRDTGLDGHQKTEVIFLAWSQSKTQGLKYWSLTFKLVPIVYQVTQCTSANAVDLTFTSTSKTWEPVLRLSDLCSKI